MSNKDRNFSKILYEICNEEGISITSFSDNWIYLLEKNDKKHFIYGYQMGVNKDIDALLCKDKVAISEILIKNNIPCIKHEFIPMPSMIKYLSHDFEYYDKLLKKYIKNTAVIKPNLGTSGNDVYKTNDYIEAKKYINKIHNYDNVAISRFINIQNEYRIIILNGNIELVYEKVTDDWIHNLGKGAIPKIIDEYNIYIKNICKNIYDILNIPLMAVDMVRTNEGYCVLEINSGLMMDNFSSYSRKNYLIAKSIYKKILLNCI